MKVLHVVKTSEGARWAAWQAAILTRQGIEVHVALPAPQGSAVAEWQAAGAHIHIADLQLPVRRPWAWAATAARIRRLVAAVAPDVIHSHFVTNTLALRLALGAHHAVPRVFQVPGPLHLEHPVFRSLDLTTAGPRDYWVASSRYTQQLYRAAGLPAKRVFLSYYGVDALRRAPHGAGGLRARLGLPAAYKIIGNINYMYPPKYFLGQTAGLKRHEDVIDALALLCRERDDVVGVLVGGQWGGGDWYLRRLQERARAAAGDRIIFLGAVPSGNVPALWPDFDCAVHVPISENCGGVIEPLVAGVPTIASQVGGLPEVVLDGVTGWTVPARTPHKLATTIGQVLADPIDAGQRAQRGRDLVRVMFDVARTAHEIAGIYAHVLDSRHPAPAAFDALAAVQQAISLQGEDHVPHVRQAVA
jgi:glycosyltransferase involved in cell wall biosynthesis